MEPVFNYVFLVRKPGATVEEVVEVFAPNMIKAVMTLAAAWPGVFVVKHLGIAAKRGNA